MGGSGEAARLSHKFGSSRHVDTMLFSSLSSQIQVNMNSQFLLLLVASVSAVEFSCPTGHYVNVQRGSFRRRRRAGRTSYSCTECPPGHYMNLYRHSQTNCYPCQAPQWQDLPGASSCKPSPSRPTLCPAGKWGLAAATIPDTPCHLCPSGKYQTNPGQGGCHQCSAGTYQPAQGAIECESGVGVCQPGSYGHVGATTRDQANTCSFCEQDTYQAYPGQDSCKPCAKGYHQPQTGQPACVQIPRCSWHYYWNQDQRQCLTRHAHLDWLIATAWTCWVLNLVYVCCGSPLRSDDSPWRMLPFYNFVVCLAIGIESSRRGGVLSDTRFWTMVGFLAISVLSEVYLIIVTMVGFCQYHWQRPDSNQVSNKGAAHAAV
jgi:hypothetical protein